VLPARPLPARKPQLEPAQVGAKRIVVKPAQVPYLLMPGNAPTLRLGKRHPGLTADRFWRRAVGMIRRAAKNAGQDASRCSERECGYDAVSRGPALSWWMRRRASRWQIWSKPFARSSTGSSAKASARRSLRGQGAGHRGEVYQRDSLFYQAMQLGEYVTPAAAEALTAVDKLRAVTASEVQAAAAWLQDDR